MIIISLGQPVFCDLFKNVDETNDEILVRISIVGDEIKERAKRSAHDSGIVIAQALAKIGQQVGDGGGRFLVEAMERHNGLLPDGVLGVVKEVDDAGEDGGDGLLVDEAADGVKGGADDEVVIGGEILLDGVNDEDDEVVIVAEEERDGEVAGALEEESVVVCHLDGVNVAEGGVVA